MFCRSIFGEIISLSEKSILAGGLGGLDVPVTAAIARKAEIVSIFSNRVEADNRAFHHAEFLCVAAALSLCGERYLHEMSLYVILEPCSLCASVLEKVRIKDIYFGAYDAKAGAIFHGPRIFDHSSYKPNIVGGIWEVKCSRIIKKFFQDLRSTIRFV